MREFPIRGVFVGVLCALGYFLILYRGFSRTENFSLNTASVSAVLVALIPMPTPEQCTNCGDNTYSFLHYVFATLLFVCMAFVAWACTEQTLGELDEQLRRRFRTIYSTLAALMFVAPLGAVAMTYTLGIFDRRVFFVELAGIWTFAIYWLLKIYELYLSGAELKAMKTGRMEEAPTKEAPLRIKASRLLD